MDEGELYANNSSNVSTGTLPYGEVVSIDDDDAAEESERKEAAKREGSVMVVVKGGEMVSSKGEDGGEFGEFSRGEVHDYFAALKLGPLVVITIYGAWRDREIYPKNVGDK